MGIDNTLRKIKSIACLDELDGYEAEAKKRGITGDELAALQQKRRELTGKHRPTHRR